MIYDILQKAEFREYYFMGNQRYFKYFLLIDIKHIIE
jgi:hypothetical protein